MGIPSNLTLNNCRRRFFCVTVSVVGNDDEGSNLARNCLHFTSRNYSCKLSESNYPPSSYEEMGKHGSLILVCQPISEKENSELKPVKLRLKLTLGRILLEWKGWINTKNVAVKTNQSINHATLEKH